ncbi:manganese transporter [Sulfitobacter sp. SK012]|uniref:metal ABC transporter solute-binding protein, Zn/Mn family n=1 Tax=Sulfitobacter sp. SK012 TaxID=1389005 RepID=UPI000E0ABC86|nr:zinc ABC transporter substrate-binding protein [Sulfitobacter sp. SK012]AXI48249.1 manganese transporter [Sulfitobacter sp. SK012]
MKVNKSDLTSTRRAALLGGLAATGLALSPISAQAETTPNVVATTGMIADAARQIGGDLINVRALMGPGVDPHGYRQTRSDIVAMTRADLVLWHGLYLEAQMERFFEDLGRKRTVIAVAEAIPKDQLLSHADYDGRYDPHVWMDPSQWRGVVSEVERALNIMAPQHANIFAANASTYIARLDALSAYASQTLAQVAPDQRVLLTAHDAFGYFGRAYGFEVIGIQGISTQSEAGLNRISNLVDTLVDRKIRAAFVETSVSDRNIRALIEGAHAQGHNVAIGGSLYSDAMGPDGTYEGTYLGMIDHNVTTIAKALGADIDPRGMAGKLKGEG